MYEVTGSPEERAFIREKAEQLQALLQEAAQLWGPRICQHGEWAYCEEPCEVAETHPAPNVMLTEFVLLGLWVNMDSNESTPLVHKVAGPNTHRVIQNGLLFEELFSE